MQQVETVSSLINLIGLSAATHNVKSVPYKENAQVWVSPKHARDLSLLSEVAQCEDLDAGEGGLRIGQVLALAAYTSCSIKHLTRCLSKKLSRAVCPPARGRNIPCYPRILEGSGRQLIGGTIPR